RSAMARGASGRMRREMAAGAISGRRRPRSIAAAVLARGELSVLVLAPHQVVVGIKRVIAGRVGADLEVAHGRRAPIDEVMRVAGAARVACAHSGGEDLLALVRDED